jgi:hypothetical protein
VAKSQNFGSTQIADGFDLHKPMLLPSLKGPPSPTAIAGGNLKKKV